MGILIKKKLELDFLGEDYKESYLTFRAIPALDYTNIQEQIKSVKDGEDDKGIQLMLDVLKKYFHEGEVLGEKTEKDDLDALDPENIIKCFQKLTGRMPDSEGTISIDPKDESSSTKQSTTEQLPQTSS